MKKHSNALNSLLETLSFQGDSAAFFSRCEHYFSARYQKERDAGVPHQDASRKITSEASELFSTFVTIPQKNHAAWIEEHCTLDATSDCATEEVLIDNSVINEKNLFLKACAHELLKTASTIKRAQEKRRKNLTYRIFHNRFTRSVLIVVVLLLLLTGTLLLMVRQNISLTISLSSPASSYSISIPMSQEASSDSISTQKPPQPAPDTTATPSQDSTTKVIEVAPVVKESKKGASYSAPPKPARTPDTIPVVKKRRSIPVKTTPAYTVPPAEPATADPWAPSPAQTAEPVSTPVKTPEPSLPPTNNLFESETPSESTEY